MKTLRDKLLCGMAVLAMAAAVPVAGVAQRPGPPPPPNGYQPQRFAGNTLRVNQSLMRGQALYSTNGMYMLEFQRDGNVVLTRLRDRRVLWDTGTANSPAERLTMQGDGNVVLYTRFNRPIWNTGITGPNMRHGQVFILQDDGNLVVYSRGQVYWASNTQRRGHYDRR